MIQELEQHHPHLFRGLVKAVQMFSVRRKALELPTAEATQWAIQRHYGDLQGLKTSVEYYKGIAWGYGMAAWSILNKRPPKDVMEEVEISEALKKIENCFEDSHEPKKKGKHRIRLEDLIRSEPPPVKPDVIKVEAKPMRQPSAFQMLSLPQYDEEDEDDIHLPILGNMGRAPAEMMYKVETEGDDGYQDQRGFTYSEKEGRFQVQMVFRAEGPGRVPPGFKALSMMKDLMNFAFNQLAGGGIVNQKIEQDSKPVPPSPEAPLHQQVLGYLSGNGDRPCL